MLLSPRSRVADTLVAGKAFGTILRTVRRLELVTDKEDMVTVRVSISILLVFPSQPYNTDIDFDL